MSANGTEGSSWRANILVVTAWVALAILTNLIFALAPTKASDTFSALPQDSQAAIARIGEAFPGTGTNAIAYLVLDSRRALGPADQDYYEAAVNALRADADHVGSVLGWWSDDLTAPMATGSGERSAVAMVWLVGEAGSPQAQQSLDAARSVVRKLPSEPDLRARIIVPATTNNMPLHMAAWQGAVVITAVAAIAVLLLLRSRRSVIAVAIPLLTAELSLAVAWPLTEMALGRESVFTVFSGTVAAVLTIGTITASTMLLMRREPDVSTSATDRGAYRDTVPALALPGACIAVLTGPLLFARTPALQSIGAASLSVVVALAASLTLLPILVRLAGPPGPSPSRTAGGGWTLPLSIPRPAVLIAVVLAICALPVIGMRWSLAEDPARPSGAQYLPGNPLPDVVVITSQNDLRDAGSVIAIDRVTRRLMEIPGVRMVQSAAWPGGTPWDEASLTAAMGRLSDQMNQQAAQFVPQLNALKQMQATMDRMSTSFDELQQSMNTGLAGVAEMQQVMDEMMVNSRNIQNTTTEVSAYLDPVRNWVGTTPNCPADLACSAVRKVIDPLDNVMANATALFDGTDRIAAITDRTVGSFDSVPGVMSEMRSAFDQMRALMDNMQKSIEASLPQMTQLSLFLRNLTNDFAGTGEGGFYLSNKQLADPSYRGVRETMFSSDGTATRLFVFSDEDRLDLDAAARAGQLETAAAGATKYGSLVGSEVTVIGAAQTAADVRDGLAHDAVLLAAAMLAVLVAVSMWRGVLTGLVLGLAMLVAYLAALGILVALWQYVLGQQVYSSVPLVSFVMLAACGIPYLVASVPRSAGTGLDRGTLAPLMVLGAVFGIGVVLVSGISFGALSQVGAVLVIGLGALTAVARICLPTALPGERTEQNPTGSPATNG